MLTMLMEEAGKLVKTNKDATKLTDVGRDMNHVLAQQKAETRLLLMIGSKSALEAICTLTGVEEKLSGSTVERDSGRVSFWRRQPESQQPWCSWALDCCLCEPAAHRSYSACDCRCPIVGLLWPQVPVNVVLHNLKQCICHGRLAKCQFRPQRAKVEKQICIFYKTLLRVLAIAAVFNTRGTRNVGRQNLRQLRGIASESLVTFGVCFVVHRPKNGCGLWVLHAPCAVWVEVCRPWLCACGRMRLRLFFFS